MASAHGLRLLVGWLAVLVMNACVASDSHTCANGIVCPGDTICVAIVGAPSCVRQDQLDACHGVPDGAPCSAMAGLCTSGVCLPGCGDGLQAENEECDCGTATNPACAGVPNGVPESPCSETCQLRYCGNAIVDPGEACDDGNVENNDSCALDCKSNVTCGNGFIDAAVGEICDDGNAVAHDGCAPTCALEVPQWTQWQSPWLGRVGHGAAFDTFHRKIVIMGGSSENVFALDDAWETDGSGLWTRCANAPTARTGVAMAYDEARHVIVLFGGSGAALLGDTWEYDGTMWTKRTPTASPPGRTGAAIAYDPVEQRIVIFGGMSGSSVLGDTWEYDGATWTPITGGSSPSARNGARMDYDLTRNRIVLFGGSPLNNETWERAGTTWSQVTTTSAPTPRSGAAFAYSAGRQRMVLFGGATAIGNAGDTWEYDGAWTPVTTSVAPISRTRATLSRVDNRLWMIGGASDWISTLLDDTPIYESTGGLWYNIRPTFVPDNRVCSLVYDRARAQTLLFGGTTGGGAVSDTWTFDGTTWQARTPSHVPPARGRGNLVDDSTRQRVVMFGGPVGTTVLADTWEWDGTDWTDRTPTLATSPPARGSAPFAYDEKNHLAVLFGGQGASGSLSDTWEYDGTAWSENTSQPHPPARTRTAMAYDVKRARIVLAVFTASQVDTWTYKDHVWAQLASSTTTPTPMGSEDRMAYDNTRGHVVLYITDRGELWELEDTDTWERVTISGGTPSQRISTWIVRDEAHQSFVMFGGFSNGGLQSDTWSLQYR